MAAEHVKVLQGFRVEAAKWGTVDGTILAALDAAIAALSAGGEVVPVAWSRDEFIHDDDGRPIGTDEPRVVWGSENPDPDEGWSPLYSTPTPAVAGVAVDVRSGLVNELIYRAYYVTEHFSPDRLRNDAKGRNRVLALVAAIDACRKGEDREA